MMGFVRTFTHSLERLECMLFVFCCILSACLQLSVCFTAVVRGSHFLTAVRSCGLLESLGSSLLYSSLEIHLGAMLGPSFPRQVLYVPSRTFEVGSAELVVGQCGKQERMLIQRLYARFETSC